MAKSRIQTEPQDDLQRIRKRARTEGIVVAYEGALAVCRDEKSRAADRLDAAGLICRIGGVFEGAGDDDGSDKPINTMSRAELVDAAVKARAYIEHLDASEIEHGQRPESDVFD